MEPIADHIFLIPGAKGGRFPFSHSILVLDRVRVLIDTGCGLDTLTRIQEQYTPDMVLLTHAHPDHCSGTAVFPPSRVWTPGESRESTGRLERMADRFVSRALREEWMEFMRSSIGFRDFAPENSYSGGDRFDLGSLSLVPVHAPGHADDHYCFYFPEAAVMVTTDIDFTRFGPWYANDEGDIDLFLESIEHIRSHPMDAAVSSHEGVVRESIQERFERFASAFGEREERLIAFLERPRDLDAIIDEAIIYGSFPVRPRILRFWERQMIEKHLARLETTGRVKRTDAGFVRIR
ncbi:MAG: MBL fold metallo-hydrolase [Deltaproteobacteria bacterium]|nr:MBL fold metallo-hydrolase [Deltaproteobacteria bacterium]